MNAMQFTKLGPESTVVVLGGGGFLGSHCVKTLLERSPARVVAVDRSLQRLPGAASRLDRIQASINDPGVLESVVRSSEIVLSTTGLCTPSLYNTQPIEVIEANFTQLVPLVRLCCEQNRWLIHFSTCEVYGKTSVKDGSSMEEDYSSLVLGPVSKERWSYACAKQLLERLIWAYGKHQGLRFSIVRPFNVIGPNMDYIPGVDGEGSPRVLANFMRALLLGEPLPLVNGGINRRAFLYVDDFVEAVFRILENPEVCQGEIINLGNPGNDIRINELAQKMMEIYSDRFPSERKPSMRTVSDEEFYGPGYEDVDQRIPNIEKASRLLGWTPATTLDEMLPGIMTDYVTRYRQILTNSGG